MKTVIILLLFTISSATCFLDYLIPFHVELKVNDATIMDLGKKKPYDPVLSENCGVSPKSCPKSQYRSYDGSCNNLKNPRWGTPNMPYGRLIPKNSYDGAKSGKPLPNARALSEALFTHNEVQDPNWTLLTVVWGQFIAHVMSLTAGISQIVREDVNCCSNGKLTNEVNTNPRCNPIMIPPNDPSHPNDQCLNFYKTLTTRDLKCTPSDDPEEPINSIPSYLDLSTIYGQNESQARSLRTGSGGKLKTENRNGEDWPPQNPDSTDTCLVDSSSEPCYISGDVRINQNPPLTMMHVMFIRLHNELVDKLAEFNPHWNDERLYQEARRITVAIFQHITINEYLVILLGLDKMVKLNLKNSKTNEYVVKYNPAIKSTVYVEHASASFRYPHSAVVGYFSKFNSNLQEIGSIRLSDWLQKPSVIEEDDTFSQLSRGFYKQPQSALDQNYDKEITEYLFRGKEEFGTDLRAIDIQRGRDHKLPSYNDARVYCGLRRAKKFSDFGDNLSNQTIVTMQRMYEDVDDVDLVVAGSLERHVTGTSFGPVFLCLSSEQFDHTLVSDSFLYGNAANGFTSGQLKSIYKISAARLLCDYGEGTTSVQARAFDLISATNPLVSCNNIPSLDLSPWKEK